MAEAGPASASSPGEPAPEPEPEPSRRQLTLLPGGAGEHTGKVLVRRYELLRELGRGGMASVYEARFLPSERRHVAVKILHAEVAEDPNQRERLVREARDPPHAEGRGEEAGERAEGPRIAGGGALVMRSRGPFPSTLAAP